MSGTIDHESAQADVPVQGADAFFFVLSANDAGITDLRFRKNGPLVMQTLMMALEYINSTFETPYPTLGVLLRDMADKADHMEELYRDYLRQQAGEESGEIASSETGQGEAANEDSKPASE